MNWKLRLLTIGLIAAAGMARAGIAIEELVLTGRIQEDNILFTYQAEVEAEGRDERFQWVQGDLALLETPESRRVTITREGDRLMAALDGRGSHSLDFTFAARVVKEGAWRSTRLQLPEAAVRRCAILAEDQDFEVVFPGALRVHREAEESGLTRIEAYLPAGIPCVVRWKPRVRHLAGSLVASCDANTVVTATVGALHLDSAIRYSVAQGELNRLRVAVPEGLRVTRVDGSDILSWRLEDGEDPGQTLVVQLNRATRDDYVLRIFAEQVLPDFPCRIPLPMPTPQEVLRTSGFVYLGTDQAIKLSVAEVQGASQINPDAFPIPVPADGSPGALPGNSVFVYQFANLPVRMVLTAADIVPAVRVDQQLVFSLEDRDARLDAALELDVREAPLRELRLPLPTEWTLVQVEGSVVQDYSVHDGEGGRELVVLLGDGVIGRARIDLRLEHSLPDSLASLTVPQIAVDGAKSERGFIVVRGEEGLRLKPEQIAGLREVPPGSLPIRLDRVQSAYRFQRPAWSLTLAMEHADAAMYAELFHLISLGDEAVFGSCSVTYHIKGSPTRTLRVSIPETYSNIDFIGGDIRNWVQDGTEWTLTFQEKIFGDYTLLITYDRKLSAEQNEVLAGGIATLDTDSETGFIAVAGTANLGIETLISRDEAVLPLERMELPEAYRLLINDPVIEAYRYVASPHEVKLALKRFPTGELLGTVTDHASLVSRVSREGEVVTTAHYFVKNMSDQYLTLVLPEGADLWAVRVDGREVQALQGTGPGEILVPLDRHRDPNQASQVEVEFARVQAALGWQNQLALAAPTSPSQSVFCRWEVAIPEQYAMARTGGTLTADPRPAATGLVSLVERIGAAYGLLLRRAPTLFVIPALALMLLGLGELCLRRGRWVYAGVVVFGCLVLLVLSLPSSRVVMQCIAEPNLAREALTTQSFSRVVNLAHHDLSVDLRIVPAWVGASGSVRNGILGIAGALAVLVVGRRRGLANGWTTALAVTLATWGLSQTVITVQFLFLVLVVGVPLFTAVVVWRALHLVGEQRRAAHPVEDPPPLVPPVPTESQGFIRVPVLVGLAVLSLAVSGLARSQAVVETEQVLVPCAPPSLQAALVALTIEAPRPDPEVEPVAAVRMHLELDVDDAGELPLVQAPYVVTHFEASSDKVELVAGANGYRIVVAKRGRYTVDVDLLAPVVEKDGRRSMPIHLPNHLRHTVALHLPADDYVVESPDLVYREMTTTDEGMDAKILLAPVTCSQLVWRPLERRTRLEEAVAFGEVRSLATFDRGVIHLVHEVTYRIAQGELQSFGMTMPEGMSITAVQAEALSTWRFDPDTRQLTAVLERPFSGGVTIGITGQIARDRLPYQVEIGVPQLDDVEHQRGNLGLAVRDGVQIHPVSEEGLLTMNLADFVQPRQGPQQQHGGFPAGELKRTYRYQAAPAVAVVDAVAVLPELRVEEEGRLDLSDERTLLATRIRLTINRAGLFGVPLTIPEGFDVETLEGKQVSHWDDPLPGRREIMVHFTRQVTGGVDLHLVLVRNQKQVPPRLTVPRVEVAGAAKHRGTLAVTAERGLRLLTETRSGVSEVHPRELGVTTPHALAYKILRPGWAVELTIDRMPASVKSQVLQDITIREGMLTADCRVQYVIDHAGIKQLQLRAPRPGVVLTVQGTDVGQVREIDREAGIWQVDLRNKTEQAYTLSVRYQYGLPARAERVTIRPLLTVGTQGQTGYVTVHAGGRLQVQADQVGAGLRAVDARNIPATLATREMSDAILCYQAVNPEYALQLAIKRHEAASVLPATVHEVRMDSVLSSDGQLVTRVLMQLNAGDLRFLKAELPKGDRLWACFVAGQPVTPLQEGGQLMIPLDAVETGTDADVELVVGGTFQQGRWRRNWAVKGPTFDLPLRDIQWTLYAPPQYRYRYQDGTLQPLEDRLLGRMLTFDARTYTVQAQAQLAQTLERAEQDLKKGERYAKEGKQREARKAFESAMMNSVGQSDFNEDARVQYESLARRQAIVGLVNRRANLKKSHNLQDADEDAQLRAFQAGQWTEAYGAQVEQSLDAKDNQSLTLVADKILEQQSAASEHAPAIRITLPAHGQPLQFHRALQIEPMAPMTVELKRSSRERSGGWLSVVLMGVVAVGWGGARSAWRKTGEVS